MVVKIPRTYVTKEDGCSFNTQSLTLISRCRLCKIISTEINNDSTSRFTCILSFRISQVYFASYNDDKFTIHRDKCIFPSMYTCIGFYTTFQDDME